MVIFFQKIEGMLVVPAQIRQEMFDEIFLSEGKAMLVDLIPFAPGKITE